MYVIYSFTVIKQNKAWTLTQHLSKLWQVHLVCTSSNVKIFVFKSWRTNEEKVGSFFCMFVLVVSRYLCFLFISKKVLFLIFCLFHPKTFQSCTWHLSNWANLSFNVIFFHYWQIFFNYLIQSNQIYFNGNLQIGEGVEIQIMIIILYFSSSVIKMYTKSHRLYK